MPFYMFLHKYPPQGCAREVRMLAELAPKDDIFVQMPNF